jgi:hypothetical protein
MDRKGDVESSEEGMKSNPRKREEAYDLSG